MRLWVIHITFLVFLSSVNSLRAHEKVVVVPLNSAKQLVNVITVSQSGGDFTEPIAAVESIVDADDTNPYLVVIGPGIYKLSKTLTMKPYVDIAGSGQNITTLTANFTSHSVSYADQAAVVGADNCALSFLTIENSKGSINSIALYNGNSSPRISNVTVIASGGSSSNYGILNEHSSAMIIDVTTSASGGDDRACGIYNYNYSSTRMIRVTARAAEASGENYGIYNRYYSSTIISDVVADALGGSESYGIRNYWYSSPNIRRSTMAGATGGLGTTGNSPPTSASQPFTMAAVGAMSVLSPTMALLSPLEQIVNPNHYVSF